MMFLKKCITKDSNGNRWRKVWKDYIETLKEKNSQTEYFTSRQLRHTFCTILYNSEIDAKTAKEWMGHSDIKITLGLYTHLDRIQKRKSMEKVNRFLEQNFG